MNRSWCRVLILAGGVAALALFAGCVTREVIEIKPREEVTLMMARSGESVTLQWRSEIGRNYTVLYSERMGGGGQWKPLPGATDVQGTGALITLTDDVPSTMQRYYRLHIGNLPAARKP